MGNFSREPKDRLSDSIAKHYVGVRMQQGVPVLDADWNELEDLRRHEFEDTGKWVIGNGVPSGNDGFRIAAIAGGGVGTLLLESKFSGVGLSKLRIDVDNSTAVTELGFDENNAFASRFGSSPAQLTGNMVEPFGLSEGQTLVVQAEEHPLETVTFTAGDFVDISAATAVEVAAAVTAAMSTITARAGNGNDFIIKGGGGTTTNAGRVIVDGQMALNEKDLKYSEQALYNNEELARLWGVEPVEKLITPTTDKICIVFIDIWHREVDSEEDSELIDIRIGIESAIRLKREWAVRVANIPEDLLILENPAPGHVFYQLAKLKRLGGDDSINAEIIEELRDTQLSIQRKIEVLNDAGITVIDNDTYLRMLENTRNNVLAFIRYITTQFNTINSHMVSAEILGLQAAEHIARTAEIGIGLINGENLANRGALKFLFQIYNAENNFMTVWRDIVLQIGGIPKKYESYQNFINRLDQRLHQPTVGLLTGLLPALEKGNLVESTKMQEEIARLIGAASSNIARGSIQVFLAQSPPGILIQRPEPYRFMFRAHSYTTLADTYTVTILPEVGWQRRVVDVFGTPIPNNRISIGPDGSETEIFIDVIVQSGSSGLQLRVTSDSNPTEIDQLTGLFTLTEGQPAPIGQDKVQIRIESVYNAILDTTTGVVSIQRSETGSIQVRIFNNTGQQQTFDVVIAKENELGTWDAIYTGDTPVPINNNASVLESVDITPDNDAVSMELRVTATTTISGSTVQGDLVIPLESTI